MDDNIIIFILGLILGGLIAYLSFKFLFYKQRGRK